MDNINYRDKAMEGVGIPYDNINWYDMEGQPFGLASEFNVIVFNDANNIVDVEGPVAIGGSFYSPRGLSVGFTRDNSNTRIDYSPDLVRFLVGGNVSMTGPLVVMGHVVVGGGFRAAKGSTYFIGKDSRTDGLAELEYLYQANGGSQYWAPTDKGDHYVISSYDVPRYIPARRINANLPKFFNDAKESIRYYKNCIEALTPNGNVIDNNYEWILRGNDPVQNVFLLDVRPNGLINKGLRADVPQGSTVIVRLRTGANAHMQYGVYGERSKANQTMYVFEDATNIHMEKSSDIWGSILAPQAMFHAHPTGGHVSGNAALRAFAVDAKSGFEFHYFPFVGRVICQAVAAAPDMPTPVVRTPVVPSPAVRTPVVRTPVVPSPAVRTPVAPSPVVRTPVAPTPSVPAQKVPKILPAKAKQPIQVCPECPKPVPCPTPQPCPECPPPAQCPECPKPIPCPTPQPCPECPTCPQPVPCPTPQPCPECPKPVPCPTPQPCPECPNPVPCPTCPECPTCPTCPECPTCPKPVPCPTCPECPKCPPQIPCPPPRPCPECPKPVPCPTCPECPKCPPQIPCPTPKPCPACMIKSGIIKGCIWGCNCGNAHQWEVELYKRCNDKDTFLFCVPINCYGCFEFKVPYEGCYILRVRLAKNCCKPSCCNTSCCKPLISLKNVGVANLMIE